MNRRRNRDRLWPQPECEPHSQGPASWLPVSAASAEESAQELAERQQIEQLIANGHFGLRFPAAIESAFLNSIARHRRHLLTATGVVGAIGYYLGSAQDHKLMPDADNSLDWSRDAILLLLVVSLSWMMMPLKNKKLWQYEVLTTLNKLSIACTVVAWVLHSHVLNAYLHSVVLLQLLMYSGLVAQQRFWYTLGSAIFSFSAYALLVDGRNEIQTLVAQQNIKLFAAGMGFTVLANYLFEYRSRKAYLWRRLEQLQSEALLRLRDQLLRLSMSDPLTGLNNRRKLDADLELAYSQGLSSGQGVGLLMIDIDHFKRYNDNLGHPAGDECLRQVARALNSVAERYAASMARVGGEEFALLLPIATAQSVQKVGQAVCEAVRAVNLPHPASPVSAHVTVSVGACVAASQRGETTQQLMTGADRALYEAKAQGRDRCVSGSASQTDSPPSEQEPTDADSVSSGTSVAQRELDELDRALHKGVRWLWFGGALEQRYAAQGSMAKGWRIALVLVLGLLLLDAYVLSSQAMFHDVVPQVMQALLVANIGVAALSAVVCLPRCPPLLREAIYPLGTLLTLVSLAWAFGSSQLDTILTMAVAVMLVPLFGTVTAGQSFWAALVSILGTCASLLFWIRASSPAEQAIVDDMKFMILNSAVYTLIVAYVLDRGRRLEWALVQTEQLRRAQLQMASRELERLSVTDALTQLFNRRQFEAEFARAWDKAESTGDSLAMLILDVDHFKAYNDGYGHPAGDRCLKQIAGILAGCAKQARGLAVRLGGEEFGVMLPGQSLVGAAQVAQDVVNAVRDARLEHRYAATAPHVTVSVGAAAMCPQEGLSKLTLLAQADDALYLAKSNGRNQVGLTRA